MTVTITPLQFLMASHRINLKKYLEGRGDIDPYELHADLSRHCEKLMSDLTRSYPLPSSTALDPTILGSTRHASLSTGVPSSVIAPVKKSIPCSMLSSPRTATNMPTNTLVFNKSGIEHLLSDTDSECSSDSDFFVRHTIDPALLEPPQSMHSGPSHFTHEMDRKDGLKDESSKYVVESTQEKHEIHQSAMPATSHGSVRRQESDQKGMPENPRHSCYACTG